MPVSFARIAFNDKSLRFCVTEPQDGDLVAIMEDADEKRFGVARDAFLGHGKLRAGALPWELRRAEAALGKVTRQSFSELLADPPHALWLKANELEDGLFALSFHEHPLPNTYDRDALRFILTAAEINEIRNEIGQYLLGQMDHGEPAMQASSYTNYAVLRGCFARGYRSRSDEAHVRIKTRFPQPPRHDLKIG